VGRDRDRSTYNYPTEHAIQIAEADTPSSSAGCIQVTMFDKEGRLVDKFSDETLTRLKNGVLAWSNMRDLYRLARGYALAWNSAYDTVLRRSRTRTCRF